MKILFLTLYPEAAASPRYRVTQFLPYLRENGFECTVSSAISDHEYGEFTGPNRKGRAFWYHLAETPRRIRQLLDARRFDVVFVQKALMTAYVKGMAGMLIKRAKRLVYDFDDAVHLAPPHPLRGVWRALEDHDQVNKIIKTADLVLAGNSWLAEVARQAGARTEILPTCIDTERFVPAASDPGCYRIGWIGTTASMVCLEPAKEALEMTEDADVCLIGAEQEAVRIKNAVARPWSFDTEVEELQRFSIGIMPLPKTEWMKGKCASKALLYMACGIPCVVTPYGAALDLIEHEVNGLLADSTQDWLDAFERLRDDAFRKRLGQAARRTIEERYSLKKAAPQLKGFLESVA